MIMLVSGSTKSVAQAIPRWRHLLGHLLTPKNRNSIDSITKTGLPWGCDNGCFGVLDVRAFLRMLDRIEGQRPLWVVCPDKVACAKETLTLWDEWSWLIIERGQTAAFVLQDGQEDYPLPEAEAYFIGGSTRWKCSTAAWDIAREVKRHGKWLHMGRVNSFARMQIAYHFGCDSIDGSSASMFGDKYIWKYCQWLEQIENQGSLFHAPSG